MINYGHTGIKIIIYRILSRGPNRPWEIGRFSMITRRYVGKLEEKVTTEYEKLVSLLGLYYVSLMNFQKLNGEKN